MSGKGDQPYHDLFMIRKQEWGVAGKNSVVCLWHELRACDKVSLNAFCLQQFWRSEWLVAPLFQTLSATEEEANHARGWSLVASVLTRFGLT